jgi:hypothetical protein
MSFISPGHIRTDRRAPLWCSESSTKAATQQGGGFSQNLPLG